jgi:hypothetical protein
MNSKLDLKFTASEIVRGMTNAKLTKEQKQMLKHVAEIVISNHIFKTKK